MPRLIFLIFIILILQSCKRPVVSIKPTPEPAEYNQDMVLTKELRFPLDSTTTPEVETLNYYDSDSGELSFYAPLTKKIYFYSIKTLSLVDTLNLNKLPITKPVDIYGHYVHNYDSIFLIDPWKSKVYLINRKGSLKDSFLVALNPDKTFYAPAIALANSTPAKYLDGKLYITGASFGEFEDETSQNRPCFIVLDLKSSKTTYLGRYSDLYQVENPNWGGTKYRSVFSTFNRGVAVLSFPAEHNLIRLDLGNGEQKVKYAGSRFFDSIPSFNEKKKLIMDKDRQNKHYAVNGSYASVIFDQYRKLVYRVAELPLKSFVEGIREKSVKQYSIIILDSNYRKVGETLIPHLSHSRLSFFVSPMGLNLRKYEPGEDYLVISTFTPTPSRSK